MTTFVDQQTTVTAAWLNSADSLVTCRAITALKSVVSAADRLAYYTGDGAASLATFTAFGRTLLAMASAAELSALLEVGSIAYIDAQDALKANIASPTFTGTVTLTSLTAIPGSGATSSYFQNNVLDGATNLSLKPNGISTNAVFKAVNVSNIVSAGSRAQFGVTNAAVILDSTPFNGGTTLPFQLRMGIASDVAFQIDSSLNATFYGSILGPTITNAITIPAAGRFTITPNVTFDIQGVVASSIRFNGSVTLNDSTYFEAIGFRTLTTTYTGGGTVGTSACMEFDHTVVNINAGQGGYGVIGSVTMNSGTGKITSLYGRVVLGGTTTGIGVAATIAVTYDTGATANGVSSIINCERSGSNVGGWPIGIYITSNLPGSIINNIFVCDSSVAVGATVIQWNQRAGIASGYFLLEYDPSSNLLWWVDYLGNMSFAKASGQLLMMNWSDATLANRGYFVSNVVNGNTLVSAMPNGSSTTCVFKAYNTNPATNSGMMQTGITSTTVFFDSNKTGSGTTLPMELRMNGTSFLTIDATNSFLNCVTRLGVGNIVPVTDKGFLTVLCAAFGNPAASGATDANIGARIGAGNAAHDIGIYTSGAGWHQVRAISDLSVNYALTVCPNGGDFVAGLVNYWTAHPTVTHGEQWIRGSATELLTLSTVGLTTDTAANLLPANSVIEAVVTRITTTITTTTNWAVGDPTTAARFSAANATKTAGTTQAGIDHWSGAVATLAAGPSQAAAAKVRITCTGANPGAGVVRITVFYRTFVPPTS